MRRWTSRACLALAGMGLEAGAGGQVTFQLPGQNIGAKDDLGFRIPASMLGH